VRLVVLLLACGGTPMSPPPPPDGGGDLKAFDLKPTCNVDLAGTQRQICGLPDFSFSPELCICLGDE
jgi:hypothetical protein